MTATSFLWFIATIVVIVGAVLVLRWALDYMGTPEQPKRVLMVVVIVVAAVFVVVYVLRLFQAATLF